MKRILMALSLVIIAISTTYGQSEHPYNFYGQVFGPSTGFAIGMDSRFKAGSPFGYSVGLGYTGISWDDDYGGYWNYTYKDVDSKGLSIPLEVNAIFGKRASKFEIGIAATPYILRRDQTYQHVRHFDNFRNSWMVVTQHRKVTRVNIAGALSIGYRLQRTSGFFLKAGLSLLFGDLDCSPFDAAILLPNICVGYTIPHF